MLATKEHLRKPAWLNKKIVFKDIKNVKNLLRDVGIHTVCEEASCPNISECFSHNIATFLILGNICTRTCAFCNVNKGIPNEIDEAEPQKVALAVKRLGLKHVVVTASTRDDLKDGGASIFAKTVDKIKEQNPNTSIELLISDLYKKKGALKTIVDCKPDILAHNLETVKRLQKEVRRGATYERSLNTLKEAKNLDSSIKTKSAMMLGLGERRDEVIGLFADLLSIDCRFLSIGQYLAPSHEHISVKEYVPPKIFDEYRDIAIDMGFEFIKSSPYTRSSYMAHEYMQD